MAASGSFNTSGYDGRYLTFSWTEKSQSIENNQTTINWSLKGAGTATDSWYMSGNFKVVIAGTTVYSSATRIKLYNGTTVASGTFTFTHGGDGTKSFTASAEAGVYYVAVNCKGSGTFTLDAIPRMSSLSASNGTLGTAQTLSIDRKASSFTHTITYKCGSASGTIATKSSSTSISWTPPLSLASQNTTGTSVSVTFTITTYSGSTSIGSNTKAITCAIPSSVSPSCSLTLEDTTGWGDTYGQPVQGLSKMSITVNTTPAYSSPIASFAVTADGGKYTTAKSITGLLKTAGDSIVTATVKDKRGRSGSASYTMKVLAYKQPNVSKLTVHRCDQDGTENEQGEFVRVVFSASVTALNDKNTAAYTLRFKKSGSSTYTTVNFTDITNTYTVSNKAHVFAADSNSSYDVEIEAKDRHGAATRSTSASTAFTLINWGADGTSMGIGKVAEKEGALQVGLDLETREPAKLIGAKRVSLTIASGFKLYNGEEYNQPTVYKNGAGMVELVGRLSPATENADIGATAGALMFTLPAGYRPAVSFTAVMQGSSSAVWLMTVETNGQVKASRYRKSELYETPDTAAWMPFHVTYMAAY